MGDDRAVPEPGQEPEPRPGEGNEPRRRGDAVITDALIGIVRTLTDMEQGRRGITALDKLASPLAARRIHKVVSDSRQQVAAGGWRPHRTRPIRILSATATRPCEGVAEGVVIVADAKRSRPYTIRLEQHEELWRIVELAPPDLGLRPAVTEASRTGRPPGSAAGSTVEPETQDGPDGIGGPEDAEEDG